MDTQEDAGARQLGALERAKHISQSLSDAARRARFSTRSRRILSGGGFQARRGTGVMRLLTWISFVLVVLIPTACAVVYYGFIAADQFVAEAQFTVTGGEHPASDQFGSMTGIPAAAIIQDTQIVTNYILSRAALERLDQQVQLRARFSNPAADFVARLNPEEPVERIVRYWRGMCDVSIKMPSGIVDLKIRAFSSQDAVDIVNGVVDISESVINDMNARMYADSVRSAEEELDRASTRLSNARLELQRARNSEGILDTAKTADALNALVTEVRSGLIKLQQEYTSQLANVAQTAPQMRALKARIDATQAQLTELQAKVTATSTDPRQSQALSNAMTRFAELDLERQIAERLYSGAAAALEATRLVAERKTMYLNTFLRPVAPQEPQYPRRALSMMMTLLAGLVGWGVLIGLSMLIRDNIA
jgi:capsular polysaccharide transport system permease protein